MTDTSNDVKVLRDLARQYAAAAAKPIQDERRRLWSDHNSLHPTRPPVLATFGMWNVWCREVFGDDKMKCQDPFYRECERWFRMQLFQDSTGDDSILEPWVSVWADQKIGWGNLWGFQEEWQSTGTEGGARQIEPVLKNWDDMKKLVPPQHCIDEEATRRSAAKMGDAIGDMLPININRGPVCQGFLADISTCLARLRGLEQMMIDMYESPRELHALLAFMRDGILQNHRQAEEAGDWCSTDQSNQQMCYTRERGGPVPNRPAQPRKSLWAYCAAQEFTLISPAMHDEFMLQYQIPIYEKFGLTAYGCCEDLTNKIGILRKVPNLRQIAAAPRADLAKCAQQIGVDYVISWRPNPADHICCGFNEDLIRADIRRGLQAAKGCRLHIHLKDIETVEGDPSRLARWVDIVRQTIDQAW